MEGKRRRTVRHSKRSKCSSLAAGGSRNNYAPDKVDPRERIKDCCRKFIAFMCTQVGVGGLVVCYTLVGAFGFSKIESTYESNTTARVETLRHKCAQTLWTVAHNYNILDKGAFFRDTDVKLYRFQRDMVALIKDGYDGGRLASEIWSFPAALMFSLSIITMIGYGNMVPKTGWGKLTTVIYAVFGIPLYVLYFLNMGEVLAGCFRWVYTRLYECSTDRSDRYTGGVRKRIVVPSTACLWVIGGYVLTGAIMFAAWEHWTYLDSTYFCVTSLCKLGLGDFVPGAASKSGNETKLVINFIYMLVGLGLVAMCYNLMREEIKVKMQELKEDFNQCLEDTRVRFLRCCRRR